MTELLLVW